VVFRREKNALKQGFSTGCGQDILNHNILAFSQGAQNIRRSFDPAFLFRDNKMVSQ
jgi:hypothetical protein